MLAGTAVRVGAQRFGALAIGLPLAPLEAKVAALRNQGLVTTMVATFVGTLIAVFVSRTITHPIRALTDVATQLSQGDLDQRVSIGAGAEIGLLADTMNSMADELQNTQKKLAYDALHDGLTNLPNRTLFLDRLNHAIKKTKRVGENFFAVIFLDIDRFKLVNDSLGHAIGDLLLIEIAKRLQNCLRPGDTVARLGGDEFAMLLENITETAQVTRIADRIQEILMQPNFLEDNQIFISASIGIALSIDEDKSAEDIIRDADTAMYRAKSQGKARYEFFDPDMHAAASSLMQLEVDLRQAIENQEFIVFYQPLISLESGRIVATEALIRWQHPNRGLLTPGVFMPILEETDMIIPVGEWVLQTACTQNKSWQDAGHPELRIAVNFSARQFEISYLPDMIQNVLDETGLSPETLELEITESVAIKDREQTIEILNAIHEIGVGISLDDFGSGYSSLSYLNKYPFQKLKADRSFVMGITDDPNEAAITAAIIAMAHSLKLRVVAEGVETKEQLDLLYDQDCDEVQGYYFSRPIPAKQLAALLQNKQLIPKTEKI
ncbi:MAG: EAL domain-containing protein [Anaerolineales bacterium]|nr:EAL domain-containing protein [Anaerolineales bacterium]